MPALAGIAVHPQGKFTAASNGAMLVEVSAPAEDGPGKDPEPFILPASVAQRLAKELSDGASVQVGSDKAKPILAVRNGKKAEPVTFEPIQARYPDTRKPALWSGKVDPVSVTCEREYLLDGFRAAAVGKYVRVTLSPHRLRFESEPRDVTLAFGKPDGAVAGELSATFNAEYLRNLLAAGAIGPSVTLTLWGDRLRIESRSDKGQSARGVLMCFGPPAPPRSGASAPPPPAAAPAPSTPPSRFRAWGRRRKTFRPQDADPAKPPTPKQRMLYTYFLRRHGRQITPELLASNDFVGKIEELKKGLSYDPSFATWPQWKKINYLLLERQAPPETVCEVLNGISDVKTASEAIDAWSKKAVPAA